MMKKHPIRNGFGHVPGHAERTIRGLLIWVAMVAMPSTGSAVQPARQSADAEANEAAERGYRLLIETPLLPSDFSQSVFDEIWQSWPDDLREKAADATTRQRSRMAFERYGLTTRPGDDSGRPLQYVVGEDGGWTMNCFSCHGGSVYGEPTPGAPNNRFALQTLTEEIRSTKWRLGVPLGRMDVGSMIVPLGTTNGTTNAVVFGMGLMHYRDKDLKVLSKLPAQLTHHDMDAPAWWHFSKRPFLYIDGFARKGHRGLMQFALVPENGPEFFHGHEDDFRDVFAYLSSLTPPRYDGPVDQTLAARGRHLFEQTCAECHGTYGVGETYPNRRVPIDELGTDPVRLRALSVEGREKYADSWFAHAGEADARSTVVDPDGYVAPPLDGVWASPPYFHNGSVPTLWGVLNPSHRPAVWRRSSQDFNAREIGFRYEVVDRVPLDTTDPVIRRSYFDTGKFGKSNAGHDYPDELTIDEKLAVLEYLKTL